MGIFYGCGNDIPLRKLIFFSWKLVEQQHLCKEPLAHGGFHVNVDCLSYPSVLVSVEIIVCACPLLQECGGY